MTALTAQQPSSTEAAVLLAELARPSRSYKRRTWLAAGALALFMVLYALLAGWFLFTAYRLSFGASPSGKDVIWGYLIAICALFLAIFMLKAFVFVKRGSIEGKLEVTPQEQPQLFAFLSQLADSAGAPRPHRVFLSPQVNAAVFYDLSILNLLFPSRKNLEIGLGLVNSLSVGELRAVLAHEFGHFTQRSMAVGRWGYIAQQIASHLVHKRDKLDNLLQTITNIDIRIAWIGWLLSLVIWSIRSLVDSAFRVALLMQRALSREMEMHADLVAVSLTGSDALIHALHRLQAADDSWQRALNFAAGEKANGCIVEDIFAVQSHIMACMRRVMNDPGYGCSPELPDVSPEQHRLFKAELAQPPHMWLTHPLNHEREANAKLRYIPAPIDTRSAWDIFDNPQQLRQRISATLADAGDQTPVPQQESRQHLDEQFEREHLNGRYRGVYWGRSAVRHAADVDSLYDKSLVFAPDAGSTLYPPELSDEVELLNTLEREREQLRALERGILEASEGVIRYRGRQLRRSELAPTIATLEKEIQTVNERLQAHYGRCRSWHLAAAEQFGAGWPEYLRGLLAVVHYAEHSEANLRDAQGLLGNVIAIETAVRRVNSDGLARILKDANALHQLLDNIFEQHAQVMLDPSLRQRLGDTDWTSYLGEFKLLGATRENINDWLKVVDGWVAQAANACAGLRTQALEQLLLSEARLAEHVRLGTAPGAAGPASQVPADYDTLLPGNERPRRTRLGWWGRFLTADGKLAGAARFSVAIGIIASMLMFGENIGNADLTVYNGLAIPVTVQIGATRLDVAPLSTVRQSLVADRSYDIRASTSTGQLIESFSAETGGNFGNVVYNIASASPLVEWTATYGNATPREPRRLGAQRWTHSAADLLFEEPPRSISTKGGGGSREVLSGTEHHDPDQALALLGSEEEKARLASVHALWEPTRRSQTTIWLWLAAGAPGFDQLLQKRLAETPHDVVLLRMEQDTAKAAAKPEICRRHAAMAEVAPENGDLHYIALRCTPDSPDKEQAFASAHQRWPDNGWLANSAAYIEAAAGRWKNALALFELANTRLPQMATPLAFQIVRLRRLQGADNKQLLQNLQEVPELLKTNLSIEGSGPIDNPEAQSYRALSRGRLGDALQFARQHPETEARVLRLAAASDGAPPDLISKALALDAGSGTDNATVWFSVALAARAGRPFEPYLERVSPDQTAYLPNIRNFLDMLRQGRSPLAAEQALTGLSPEMRGTAYGMGLVMLGTKAPRSWREGAKRLLFVSERPYFS